MQWKQPDRTTPSPKIADRTHHHAYSDDGWIVECDIEHEIPPEVGQLGVRMALAWAVDHCPRIRAAIDAERRRN